MPSSMIHTIAAHKYNANASTLFRIGNLVPDSVNKREVKDRLHFRTSEDRMKDLKEMARSIEGNNEFDLGIVFHLYLDLLWDSGPMKDYIKNFEGEKWFLSYREAIGTASAWLYHNNSWSTAYWQSMCNYDFDELDLDVNYSKDEIEDFIKRNDKWHRESEVESIGYFTIDVIDEITSFAAQSFDDWIAEE